MSVRVSHAWILAAASTFLLGGCVGTSPHYPVREGTRPPVVGIHPVAGLDAPLPDHWRRIFIGQLPRPQMTGYIRSHAEKDPDGNTLNVHWVYDYEFNLVGVVSDTGSTTRFDRFGKPHYLGKLPLDKSVLAIYDFDQPDQNPVRFFPMPEPKDQLGAENQ